MLESYKFVVDNSKYVKINYEKIKEFSELFKNNNYKHWLSSVELELNEFDLIKLVFLLESINFCFWQNPEYVVKVNNTVYKRSSAMFYMFIEEVKYNKFFLNNENLINLDFISFSKIFESLYGELSLLEDRYNNFMDTVRFITRDSFFDELFSIMNTNDLLDYICIHIKHFNDISIYKNKEIKIYKRLNLLINDLFRVSDTIKSNIKSVDFLYGCADYGIPRTFVEFGIFSYTKELSDLISLEKEIKNNSDMEIEIRANTLFVIEYIKNLLNNKGILINSVELDNLIWSVYRNKDYRTKVHHTTSIYY